MITTALLEGRIKRIHINQHNIKHNAKVPHLQTDGKPASYKPVVTVKTSANNHKGFRCSIGDKTTLIYSPHKPLACGAKVWIETTEKVII